MRANSAKCAINVVVLIAFCTLIGLLLEKAVEVSAQDKCASEATEQQRFMCRQIHKLDEEARVILLNFSQFFTFVGL